MKEAAAGPGHWCGHLSLCKGFSKPCKVSNPPTGSHQHHTQWACVKGKGHAESVNNVLPVSSAGG